MALDVEQLYRRYGPMVLRRCRHLLKDEEKAADAMQEVFVQVLRRRGDLEVGAPSSFLFRTATNVCLNRIRTEKRHPEDRDDELLQRIAAAPEAEPTGAAAILDRLFAREQESTRTIAVMHLLDGMTLEEVAAETGLSVSGVRKRLRTLRAHLHELGEVA